MDGLEEIIVNRQIPTLHILMSLDELPDGIEGCVPAKTAYYPNFLYTLLFLFRVQNPNTTSDFWQHDEPPASRTAAAAGRTNKRQPFGRNRPRQPQQQPRHGQDSQNTSVPETAASEHT